MDESDGPRVFEEGTITQVIGANGFNLYAGSLHIKYVERVEITTGGENPVVKIKFQSGRSRDIEENIRLAKTLPWVNII
jgi:hypothetical protein